MSQQQIAAQRSLKRRNQFRRNLPLYLMLLLPVLLLFIYNYIPMAGIVIAFQKFLPAKGVLGSKWVGLQNFMCLCSCRGGVLGEPRRFIRDVDRNHSIGFFIELSG